MRPKKRKPRRGEVYWADIPHSHTRPPEFGNSTHGGKRTWLIVSDDDLARMGCVTAIPLTGTLAMLQPDNVDYRVSVAPEHMIQVSSDSGEIVDRIALCDQMRAMSTSRFGHRHGRLTNERIPYIEAAMRNVLGLDDEPEAEP